VATVESGTLYVARERMMTLKRIARQSATMVELYFIAKNALAGVRSRISGNTITSEHRLRFSEAEPRADYAANRFEGYMRLTDLTPESLRGMRVLEVGPGDNLGAAFLFGAYGATVSTADAYYVRREQSADLVTASLLLEQHLSDTDSLSAESILRDVEAHHDLPLERAAGVLPRSSFDLVVSNAVLEHVRDLDLALASLDALLVPGGLHAHVVDLRDHGTFTPYLHELAFLGVGEAKWRLMAGQLALPNRQRISVYQEILAKLGHETHFAVTRVVGQRRLEEPLDLGQLIASGMDDAMRDALDTSPKRVRELLANAPLQDSLVQGFIIVARKPSAPDACPSFNGETTCTESVAVTARSISSEN